MAAAIRPDRNIHQFYGGSLVVTPEGNSSDGSYQVEVRSRQATVQCHVNHFFCLFGDCGAAVDRSKGTVARDSYGLAWCLKEVRTRLKLRSCAAFEIRYPTAVDANDGSGYWIPNTRSSSTVWRMAARVDLGIRSDTGESNRPPVTTIPPLLRVPRNCNRTFTPALFDPDGDRVGCRVATNSSGFDCGLCGLPGGFTLDQNSCSVTYAYDGLTGYHSIELLLEDFPHEPVELSHPDGHGGTEPRHGGHRPTPTSSLSTLPLQFTVLADSHQAPSCLHGDYSPLFLAPTPPHGANVPAFVNQTLELEVRSSAQYATIRDLILTGPRGISKTFITTGIYFIRWKPTDQDLHRHFPVCFASEARDGYDQVYQSEPRCVTVHVSHHEAVVTCNQTTMKVELERTFLVRRNEDKLHLLDFRDASCSLKSRSNATHLVAVMSLNACGTHVEEDADTITFRNQITSADPDEIITRNHVIDIAFSCAYPKKNNLTLGFRHRDPFAFQERGFGTFTFEFEFFQSQRFRQQVDGSTYPVEVYLKQMIYMQIQATSSIPNTELFVESCRATPYDNPESRISYTIIENGCVRDPTVRIFSSSKSVFRFGMEAFEFIGAHDEVYITCSVILCGNGAPGTRCSQGCIEPVSGRRRREAPGQTSSHFISQGPLRLRKTSPSEGSIPTLNLISNLVLAIGCTLACAVVIYRSRRSSNHYRPVPTSEIG
ncbi:unnamed protein product [Ophioblennius macclurei]